MELQAASGGCGVQSPVWAPVAHLLRTHQSALRPERPSKIPGEGCRRPAAATPLGGRSRQERERWTRARPGVASPLAGRPELRPSPRGDGTGLSSSFEAAMPLTAAKSEGAAPPPEAAPSSRQPRRRPSCGCAPPGALRIPTSRDPDLGGCRQGPPRPGRHPRGVSTSSYIACPKRS